MTVALSLRGSYFLLCNRYNNVIHAWPGFTQGAQGKRLVDRLRREGRRVLTRMRRHGTTARVSFSNFKLHQPGSH